LDRAVSSGKLDENGRMASLAQVSFVTDIGELADRQLVVEAVPEVEELKVRTLRLLDGVVADPDAVLASNTSSLPIMRLAMATGRPDHVVGLHFFNPVPVLPLVEVVPSLLTAPEVVDRAESFAVAGLGKQVIRARDRAGFVVNALLVPYLLSAIRMLESGYAPAGEIDEAMVRGCNHPMGPLALMDLIGLDTIDSVARSMYEEYRETRFAPPPLLARMVDAGLLGRKTGRGFHRY
jgi:3-hydroxybutyryl-CoA dehydrogenase